MSEQMPPTWWSPSRGWFGEVGRETFALVPDYDGPGELPGDARQLTVQAGETGEVDDPVSADLEGPHIWSELYAKHGRCTCPVDDESYCYQRRCALCHALPHDWPCPTVNHEGYEDERKPDEVARLRSAGDGATDARLRRLRHQIGEWAERINKHDVPDEFVSYVDADQRLLDIIWEMRDAAKEVDR